MIHQLIIPEPLIKEMIKHARDVYPKEACGILAGVGLNAQRLYKMKNIDDSGITYMMDSREQFQVMKEIRQEGLQMTAIYHSHPCSIAYPSERDIKLAFYPDTPYIIIGLSGDKPEINAFMIEQGTARRININIL